MHLGPSLKFFHIFAANRPFAFEMSAKKVAASESDFFFSHSCVGREEYQHSNVEVLGNLCEERTDPTWLF